MDNFEPFSQKNERCSNEMIIDEQQENTCLFETNSKNQVVDEIFTVLENDDQNEHDDSNEHDEDLTKQKDMSIDDNESCQSLNFFIDQLNESENHYHDKNIYEALRFPIAEFQSSSQTINAALLCLFFSGNLSQSAFKLVCDFAKIFLNSKIKIPTDLNQCTRIVENKNKLTFQKYWFCQYCKSYLDNISDKFKNECELCGKK